MQIAILLFDRFTVLDAIGPYQVLSGLPNGGTRTAPLPGGGQASVVVIQPDGKILVIGQGTMSVSGGGSGEIDGALLLAKTRDAAGNLLATMGAPYLNWNGGGGNGVFFDSCWINNAFGAVTYGVLSFREITQ